MFYAQSRPLDSVLYHQYLKGAPNTLSTDSLASMDSVGSDEIATSLDDAPSYRWDMQANSKRLEPALKYISDKLTQENLSIALIVSDHNPFVIPVWPLPRKSQLAIARTVRKACKKFELRANWMTALSALSKHGVHDAFEECGPDSYVVRRSIIQHQVVFSDEGLTLLNIDYIHTFKQLLCTLSKPNWVSHNARQICKASCIKLYHRIHCIYTGKPVSPEYIARVYPEIPFHADALDEICCEYNTNYCTATIHEVEYQPDFSAVLADDASASDYDTSSMHELADESSCVENELPANGNDSLLSPLLGVDLSTLSSWESSPETDLKEMVEGFEDSESNTSESIDVSYPEIKRPSSGEQQYDDQDNATETFDVESETSEAPWPQLSPLRINKALSPVSPLSASEAVSTVSLPPPPSYPPPPRPALPSMVERALRTESVGLPPLLPSTVFSDAVESTVETSPPQPLPSTTGASDDRDSHASGDQTIQVKALIDFAMHTRRNRAATWESLDEILESPRAYIESWSSGVVRECGLGRVPVF